MPSTTKKVAPKKAAPKKKRPATKNKRKKTLLCPLHLEIDRNFWKWQYHWRDENFNHKEQCLEEIEKHLKDGNMGLALQAIEKAKIIMMVEIAEYMHLLPSVEEQMFIRGHLASGECDGACRGREYDDGGV